MDILHINNEEEYKKVIAYIEELVEKEPNSESEEADIINHLGTIAEEWARANLQSVELIVR